MTDSTTTNDATLGLRADDIGDALQALGTATVVLTAEFRGEGPRVAYADQMFGRLTGAVPASD